MEVLYDMNYLSSVINVLFGDIWVWKKTLIFYLILVRTKYCLSIIFIPFVANPHRRKPLEIVCLTLESRRGKNINFLFPLFKKLSRFTSPVNCPVSSYSPVIIGCEGQFSSVVFFPKTYNSSLLMRKTADKCKLRSTGKNSMKFSRSWKRKTD